MQSVDSIPRKLVKRIEIVALFGLVSFASLLYSFINWQKHVHFQTFGWDTSVFDQQVYLASIFKTPHSSLHTSLYSLPVKMNALGDHFHPIVLLLGGFLYRIWADPRMLFILQSIIVSLSAIPLYLSARYIFTRLKISPIGTMSLSLAISTMYLFSVAFQAMTLDEFHDDVLVSLPILWMLYFLLRRNFKWYWISFAIILLTKEEYGILGIPLGLYIFLTTKQIKTAIITALVGIATFYLLLFQVMPALAGDIEYPHFREQNRPQNIVKDFTRNPSLFVTRFVDHSSKRKTITSSLASYGLLPLFSPTHMILPASSLALRFYDETTVRRYEFNNHYASPFIPLFAFASILGLGTVLRTIQKISGVTIKKLWLPAVVYIFFITFLQDITLHGPINSLFKKSFYETQAWEYDARELIAQVPQNVPIATQNSLLPHLSQRENFYLLPEVKDAEFIAVDLHDGPNKFASSSASKTKALVENLVARKRFETIWQKNETMLLKKL